MIKIQNPRKRFLALIIDGMLAVLVMLVDLVRARRRPINPKPSSFLIVRADHLGDVILSTPVYRALKTKYPDAEISVICGSWANEILKNNPFVDKIINIDCPWWSSIRKDAKRSSFLRSYLPLLKAIRGGNYDVFIDLRGDLRQILFFGWLPNIPLRLSYTRSGGAYMLTHPTVHPDNMHEIERLFHLLAPLGPLDKNCQPDIFIDAETAGKVGSELSKFLDAAKEEYVVVFNGGRSPLRQLPKEIVSQLVKKLLSTYAVHVVYVGSPDDGPLGAEIEETLDGPLAVRYHNTCGAFTLLEVKALIERSRLFIGTDSSVSQVSAATSVPSISLFGPVDPVQAKPLGPNKYVIYKRYPCSPCLQNICLANNSKEYSECMSAISADEIMEVITQHKLLGA